MQTVHVNTEHSREPSDCSSDSSQSKTQAACHGTSNQTLAAKAVDVAVGVHAALGRTESMKCTIKNHKKSSRTEDVPVSITG